MAILGSRVVYDRKLMSIMPIFESISGIALKDCLMDLNNELVFIVDEENIGRAIGRNGSTASRISAALNRKIKILAFSPDIREFVRNAIHPVRPKQIDDNDGVITISAEDAKSRGLLIGRNSRNLKNTEQLIRRFFSIKGIKVK